MQESRPYSADGRTQLLSWVALHKMELTGAQMLDDPLRFVLHIRWNSFATTATQSPAKMVGFQALCWPLRDVPNALYVVYVVRR